MWPIPKGRAIRSKSNISNSARTGSQSPSALTLAPNQGPGPLPAGPLNTFSPRAAPYLYHWWTTGRTHTDRAATFYRVTSGGPGPGRGDCHLKVRGRRTSTLNSRVILGLLPGQSAGGMPSALVFHIRPNSVLLGAQTNAR